MTLKSYLITMSLITLFCWGIFIFIINLVNPETTNIIGFILFYLSLFLSLIGTSAIIGFFVRFVVLRRQLVFYAVKTAFRQSFLFSLFLVSLLFLFSYTLITWFNLILLLIIFTILEIIFSSFSNKKKINNIHND
jgi:hypothetical protein